MRQGKFSSLIGDFKVIDAKMKMIDWPDDGCAGASPRSPIPTVCGDNPFADEKFEEGYGEFETESWKQVRDKLIGLAQPCMV